MDVPQELNAEECGSYFQATEFMLSQLNACVLIVRLYQEIATLRASVAAYSYTLDEVLTGGQAEAPHQGG